MRVVLVIGHGPGCGALPALIAAMRRREWSILPVVPPGSAPAASPELWRDLCGCEPALPAGLPSGAVVVLAPLSEPGRNWLAAQRTATAAGERHPPVVAVPVVPAALATALGIAPSAPGEDCRIVPPSAPLLGGGVGDLWMASPDAVCETIAAAVTRPDLAGRSVLVTAGPTAEDLDPVRYLTNRSSGLMGLSLALAAWRRGAAVTLVHGPLQVEVPRLPGLDLVPVRSAGQMHDAVMARIATQAAAILCAAVADLPGPLRRPQDQEGRPRRLTLNRGAQFDILAAVGALARSHSWSVLPETTTCRSTPPTTEAEELRPALRQRRHRARQGFAVATNRTPYWRGTAHRTPLPLLSKSAAADHIIDRVAAELKAHRPRDPLDPATATRSPRRPVVARPSRTEGSATCRSGGFWPAALSP